MSYDSTVFIDPAGGVHDLSCSSADLDGWAGRFMPPVQFLETPVPGQPGSRLDDVQVNPRDITAPVIIVGGDEVATRVALRALVRGLQAGTGDGILRCTAVDGTVRDLTCRCSGGLGIQEDLYKTRLDTLQRAIVTFRAFDPYWYDQADTVLSFGSGGGSPFFPFFPLVLSSSSVLASATIDVLGDVPCYPVWTIDGAAASVVATNVTTGEVFEIDITLGDGDSVVIDTRRGHKTVVDGTGANRFSTLTPPSSLWPLVPGPNVITIVAADTDPSSSVAVAYKNAWLTP